MVVRHFVAPVSPSPLDVHQLSVGLGGASEVDWRPLLFGEAELLRSHVTQLPYERWSNDAGMLLALAASYRWDGMKGAYAAAAHLDAADRLLTTQEEPSPCLRASSALLRGIVERQRGCISKSLEHTERAIQILQSPGVSIIDRLDLGAIAILKRGAISALAGDLSGARRDLRAGLLADESALPTFERLEALGFLAIVDILGGSIRSAERTLAQARALMNVVPPGRWHAPAMIAILLLAAERGEIARSPASVEDLIALTEGSEFEPLALHLLVLLCQARNEWEQAMDAVHRLREIEREWDGGQLICILRASDRAEVYLHFGNLAQARSALSDETDSSHIVCCNALHARVAIELGDYEGALAQTEACVTAGDDHPVRSHLYALVIDAAARWAIGDMRSADASFHLVLSHASSMKIQRVFSTVPPVLLRGLVARAADRRDMVPNARALLTDLTATLADAAPTASDLLSPRERTVLMRIAAGETPQQIASSLHVSMNTIKAHVRSIYRKLGVSTRAGAIQRARGLGVIAS